MRTRIKICGITSPEDARAAAQAGADAIGLVFHPASPRAVALQQAQAVRRALPPFVSAVALFVDPDPALVRAVIDTVAPDLLQFHGDETPEFCASFGRPWIKALRMRGDLDLAASARRYAAASGLLLDAYVAGVPGGTGATFEWSRVPRDLPLPVILAGGLNPANVAAAIRVVRPWAVDVSGGVEAAPGRKDAAKMQAFVQEVMLRGSAD